jgi:hypothetical protein
LVWLFAGGFCGTTTVEGAAALAAGGCTTTVFSLSPHAANGSTSANGANSIIKRTPRIIFLPTQTQPVLNGRRESMFRDNAVSKAHDRVDLCHI